MRTSVATGWGFVGTVFVLCLVLYATFLPDQDSEQISSPWHHKIIQPLISWNSPTYASPWPPVCTVEDIVHGVWHTDREIKSMDELIESYNFSSGFKNECGGPGILNSAWTDGKQDPSEAAAEALARILRIASPYLLPRPFEDDSGVRCQMLRPDLDNMIKRLLRSRNGLILVGDSLTEHQAKVLANVLTTDDDLFQIHIPDIWESSIKLSSTHPKTAQLLQEAGVTETRLQTPLIQFWRHHHLATTEEMRQAFAFAEDRYQFNEDYPAGANWYELMIEQATPAGRLMNSDTSATEEPTMIVLNVGAHLRDFELGANLLPSDYIEGLKNLIDCVEQKLQNAPIPLSPVLRTMAPGHVDCHKDIEPDNDYTGWRSREDIKRTKANYAWFEAMNGIFWTNRNAHRASHEFDFMSESESTKLSLNPPFRIMDVWPMSAKRADAHRGPPGDCLHWCTAGVQSYWNDLMFHMMLEESRNHDYYNL